MNDKNPSLAEIANIRKPVSKRIDNININWESGEQLAQTLRRHIVGVRGNSGSGKTFTAFSMLQDHVIDRASDDKYIQDFFDYDPQLQKNLLEADLTTRRSHLRAAHKIIFIDFDKRGADPLFQSTQCHPALFSCFNYTAVNSWEEAFKALIDGRDLLRQHETKWGRKGCWFIVDNSKKAWQLCQGDFTKSTMNMDFHEMMSEAKRKFPGTDGAARKSQSDWIKDHKDFTIISPMFDEEFLGQIILTGYNIMIMSLNTTRKVEVDQGNGIVEEEDVPMIGGSPNVPALMNYIFRKFKSKDGRTFKTEIDKARHHAAKGDVLVNPTWAEMRREMERLEREHIFNTQAKYNSVEFLDKLKLPNGEIYQVGSVSVPNIQITETKPPIQSIPAPQTRPPSLADLGQTRKLETSTPKQNPPEIEELPSLPPLPDLGSVEELPSLPTPETIAVEAWECNFCSFRNSLEKEECIKCTLPSGADPAGFFIVKKDDNEKGKFHIHTCKYARRITNKQFVKDEGSRSPCKCLGEIEVTEEDMAPASDEIGSTEPDLDFTIPGFD